MPIYVTCDRAHTKAAQARARQKKECAGHSSSTECMKAIRDERQAEDWLGRHCAFNGLSGCRDAAGTFVPTPACTGHARPSSGKKTSKKRCPHGRVKSGPRKGKCRKTSKKR